VKFLVAAHLPPALAGWLREAGHDAAHVEDVGLREADDGPIWEHASQTAAAILTKDEDFAARAARATKAELPVIVWLRVGNTSNLTFIPSGKCSDNSSELVANHRIEELITAASPHFNWIVIDSPPVLAVTDAVELARAADAVLLVARGASTPYDVAQRALAAFGNSRVLGFVLNAVKRAPRRGSYSYNYNYYYHRGPEGADRNKKEKDKPEGKG